MKSRLEPNFSAKRLAGKRIQFANLLGAGTIGCLLFLTACGEESQGLDERITQLHKELDQTQAELQSATQALQASKEELARMKANAPSVKRDDANPPPTSSTAVVSREALEASYMAAARALKKQLQSQLKDSTLGSFTLHNVQLPDNQFPITSWISLAFQSGDGKQFRVDFAVKADAKGDWVFPEPAEVVRRAAEAKKIASTSDTSERRAPNEPQSNVATTLPSNSTSVIQWPGSTSSQTSRDAPKSSDPGARQNPAAPPPAPLAPPAQAPTQAIPADRDVLIKF